MVLGLAALSSTARWLGATNAPIPAERTVAVPGASNELHVGAWGRRDGSRPRLLEEAEGRQAVNTSPGASQNAMSAPGANALILPTTPRFTISSEADTWFPSLDGLPLHRSWMISACVMTAQHDTP